MIGEGLLRWIFSNCIKAVNTIKMREIYPNELIHYGIKGQKWGLRRFQNPDGTLTAAGKRRYGSVENLERGMTKKQAAQYEAEKKEAVRSGSAKTLRKYSADLTQEEMNRAMSRIRNEIALDNLNSDQVVAGQQKVQNIVKAGGQLKLAAETVKNLYNLGAQAYNAFSKDSKLPIVGAQENDKKKEPKELSVEDQSKLFTLSQKKEKARRAKEFETLLRTKDYKYFQDHADEFSTEELQEVKNRYDALKSIRHI